MIDTLVLASHNADKLAEMRRIFETVELPLRIVGLDEFPPYPDPIEDEWTFAGNALLKARAAVAATGLPACADDSGIEVDALNQMPGVRSARWAGSPRSDERNVELLLAQIDDLPDHQRTARFVCVMALVTPEGFERTWRGTMEGTLARAPRGDGGFGYDPILIPEGMDVTSAQLTPQAKDAISHRGNAIRAMAGDLVQIIGGSQ